MPVVADVDRQALVVAPDQDWERSLADLAAAGPTPERLARLYGEVVPALQRRYADLAGAVSPVSDPSVLWMLSILQPALEQDRAEGEAVRAEVAGADRRDPGPG